MNHIAHAALYTVFVWWFTTGAIIYLDGLPRRTFKLSMLVATVVLLASLHGLASTSGETTVTGAYLAFTFALLAWGWNEMGFLMGIITGPRDTPCPAGAEGSRRLGYAIETVLHHELAIAATGFAIYLVTAGGGNQVGLWTFLALWVMRLSAKINVYLGVPNITEEFLPPHLTYLKTYFRIRPMNAAFPVSITLLTVLAAHLWHAAVQPGVSAFEATGQALLATLVVLALVEHWFMVLPIPATALWQWGLTSHAANAPATAGPVILPALPSAIAVFHDVTGTAGPIHRTAEASPAAISGTEATIVPFPTLPKATHRRRP
jgi:putative photosynthetic complex assembly protein 2